MAAREDGVRTSLNVAPSTATRSVVKNKALAAAYAGAGRFGLEIFEPDTSNAIMAALLVHDLRNPSLEREPRGTDSRTRCSCSSTAPATAACGARSTRRVPSSGIAAVAGMFERNA